MLEFKVIQELKTSTEFVLPYKFICRNSHTLYKNMLFVFLKLFIICYRFQTSMSIYTFNICVIIIKIFS